MATTKQDKRLALSILDAFCEVTKEHMAMSEALRQYPALQQASLGYMPQAKQAVDSVFVPLRAAIESGTDIQPALEALLKLL